MPSLPDLPNELLAQFLRYLLPDDVDNFSDSCTVFHSIAVSMLPNHEQLKNKYTKIYCGFFGDEVCHPLRVFRDLLENPDIIWYVKIMYTHHCEAHSPEKGQSWDEARRIAVEFKDDITRIVHACPYLADGEREGWTSSILSCRQDTAVALPASILPCLEGLDIGYYYGNMRLFSLWRRIRRENVRNPRGSQALSKLIWVEEEYSTEVPIFDMDSLENLATIPSIRHYGCKYLYHGGAFAELDYPRSGYHPLEIYWTQFEQKSKILSLRLTECLVDNRVLRSTLKDIANLRHFTYEYDWAYKAPHAENYHRQPSRRWVPRNIIESLLIYAKHSLVELDLTRNGNAEIDQAEEDQKQTLCSIEQQEGEDDENEGVDMQEAKPFIGSLQEFQVLKNIRVQNEAFVDEDAENSATGRQVHRLVDQLPASVVRVALAMPLLCEQESCQLTDGLVELKAERVPKLQEVIFETGKDRTDMKVESEIAGIRFIR